MEIDLGSEGLDGRDDSGNQLSLGRNFEITAEGAESRATEFLQQAAVVLEEDTEHLRDGEDNLSMGDIKEESLPHPFAPLLEPLGMAGGIKSPGTTGKRQETLLPAIGTADARKSAAGIAAVEIALDHFLDDRPEESVFLLEAMLILHEKAVEVMKRTR